ncbi:TPA: hypothetical protein ACH3X3_003034 [Trebouxia sp. C0006]
MLVEVQATGFPDLLWEGSFPENTTAAPVVKAFCCHYSLSQEACQLYCSNLPMAQEDALLQVQSTGPVRLPATFTPTLAFHVWHSFHRTAMVTDVLLPLCWLPAATQLYNSQRTSWIQIHGPRHSVLVLSTLSGMPPTALLTSNSCQQQTQRR